MPRLRRGGWDPARDDTVTPPAEDAHVVLPSPIPPPSWGRDGGGGEPRPHSGPKTDTKLAAVPRANPSIRSYPDDIIPPPGGGVGDRGRGGGGARRGARADPLRRAVADDRHAALPRALHAGDGAARAPRRRPRGGGVRRHRGRARPSPARTHRPADRGQRRLLQRL